MQVAGLPKARARYGELPRVGLAWRAGLLLPAGRSADPPNNRVRKLYPEAQKVVLFRLLLSVRPNPRVKGVQNHDERASR
jgi:hypothetical protein